MKNNSLLYFFQEKRPRVSKENYSKETELKDF